MKKTSSAHYSKLKLHQINQWKYIFPRFKTIYIVFVKRETDM